MRSMARPTKTTSRSQVAAACATARRRATLEAKVVMATRAERIGGVADQRQTPLMAERTQLGLIGWWADDRGRIDLPIAGVKHAAERRADDEAVRFGNRMGHGYELDIEWSERESAAERDDVHRDLGRTRLALQLGLQQRGGKRCGVDRQLEPRPQVEQRAEMILVRVGEHEAENIASLLHQIADVRHDEIDAGQRVVSESNPEIDRDPLPAVLVTEAVDREIHADLANPAKRREHEFVGGAHHLRVPINSSYRETATCP